MEIQVKQFIVNWTKSNKPESPDLSIDLPCNLIEEGYLDSMDFLNLVAALELEFSIEIDFGEMDPEEFTSLSGLTNSVIQAVNRCL